MLARRQLISLYLQCLVACAGIVGLVDCSGDAAAPVASTGSISLTESGLPSGAFAGVAIVGPAGYTKTLTGPQLLDGLTPGNYAISAASALASGTTYVPNVSSQSVAVVAGVTTSTIIAFVPQVFAPLSSGFQARSMIVTDWAGTAVTYQYKIYVPAGYTPTRQWPVIVAAHGSGERGTDNNAQLRVGLGPHIAALGEQAVVVFPQMPAFDFGNAGIDGATVGAYFLRMYLTPLDATLAEVNADRARIYAVGNSSGGFRTWDLLYQNPALFAAGISAAGGIEAAAMTQDNAVTDGPAAAISRLATMPIWIFSADDDGTVPTATYFTPIVNEWAAKGIGDPPFRHTLYHAIGGHQPTWDTAFASPATWTWLFSQHR